VSRAARWSLLALVLGAAGAALGFVLAPEAALRAYLAALLFWTAIPIGALGYVMIHHVTPGRWGDAMSGVLAGASRTLPVTGLAFLPVLLAMASLYPWADPRTAHDYADKAFWLVPWAFVGRTLLYFALWCLLAFLLLRRPHGARGLTAAGLILLVLTGSFAAIDWRMSLEPEFSSSAYGLLFLMECAVSGLAFAILAALLAPPDRRETRVRTLAAILVGIILLWAYIVFMQYLVIWSGDIPIGAEWYVKRADPPWTWLLWTWVALVGVVPFVALLPGAVRRSRRAIIGLCVLILLGRAAETLWLTLPAFPQAGIRELLLTAPMLAGLGGAWLLVFLWGWRGAGAVEPMAREAASHA
jgi:hypothetical protein